MLTSVLRATTSASMHSLIVSVVVSLAFMSAPLAVRAADAPKIAVVDFSVLTPFLGDVAGWEADKAQGNTVRAAQLNQTHVERIYRKGDNSVRIRITDYSESPKMTEILERVAAVTAGTRETLDRAGISADTTKGYSKSVTIDGMNLVEKYENAGKKGTVSALVAGRYYVQIKTQGLPASELQAWVKRIDLKRLAEVK